MKKKKNALVAFVSLLVSLLMLPSMSFAALMEAAAAKQVAQSWLSHIIETDGSWGGAKEASIAEMQELTANGRLLGYKFSVHPSGYILVSTMDQLPPIKSFSTTHDLDVESNSGYPALLKDAIGASLGFLEKSYGVLDQLPQQGIAPSSNAEAWDWLSGKREEPGRDQDIVSGPILETSWDAADLSELAIPQSSPLQTGALLSSAWDQLAPYNNDCPAGDAGCVTCPGGASPASRTLVGCVATAASQIMKYWQYPLAGAGSHSYTWAGDTSCGHSGISQTLSATFSATFDWNNILNSYSGSYNASQAAAVAKLSYQVGVAFDMNYGRCASGAYTDSAVTVYPTYFQYARSTVKEERKAYASATLWFAQVRKEFDNPLPRPILYGIYGHAIVCDGYRISGGTNYMHLNYGWGGSNDDWYAVDNLYCPWSGCSYLEEYMVRGIQPKNLMYSLVRGTDNGIYETWFDDLASPKTWRGGWNRMWGATLYGPASAGYRNMLYWAVVGTDQSIYVSTKNGKGEWSGWSFLGGATIATPAMTAFNDKLYMAVTGTDKSIYTRYMDSSGTWSNWIWNYGQSNHGPALAALGDRLYLLVTGTDNRIYFRTLLDTGTWSEWNVFPTGASVDRPSAVAWDSSIRIAVRGGDNGIWWNYLYFDGANYNYGSWANMSGATLSAPVLAVMPEDASRLYVMVRGMDDGIWYRWWDRGTGTWGGWNGIYGQTPDSPSLHVSYYYVPPTTGHSATGGLPVDESGLELLPDPSMEATFSSVD
jgi:hypothetical protein